jgi:hypothetical protein
MWMWLCVLFGTALLALALWAGLKWYGIWAMKRDEAEREKLAAEWKRRAAERKAKAGGGQPPEPGAPEEAGENPPRY